MSAAIVLGNGKSRLTVPHSSKLSTYGCNAIYRDMTVDFLTAVDVKMQHEIYSSGYPIRNICYFTQWDIQEAAEYESIKSMFGHSLVIENTRHSDRCIISGADNNLYVTWLYPVDRVIALPTAPPMSTGLTSLDIAAQDNSLVFMTGFDIENSDNIYLNTALYENSYPLAEWYSEHERIYKKHPFTVFARVNCGISEFKTAEFSNVYDYSLEEFQKVVSLL